MVASQAQTGVGMAYTMDDLLEVRDATLTADSTGLVMVSMPCASEENGSSSGAVNVNRICVSGVNLVNSIYICGMNNSLILIVT